MLKFCSWNIYGLTQDKLDIMNDFLQQHNVILLTETWTDKSDSFYLEGYEFENFPRSHRHINAKRNSG